MANTTPTVPNANEKRKVNETAVFVFHKIKILTGVVHISHSFKIVASAVLRDPLSPILLWYLKSTRTIGLSISWKVSGWLITPPLLSAREISARSEVGG
jgi:superfamily I DNA and/or RNA helicase